MQKLNLPHTELKINRQNGKDYVFDSLRRRFVRLTPEEFVRQHFINYLINHLKYPQGRLANEVNIELGNVQKRCDTVLYDETLNPLLLVEYKAPTVEITQTVFDQIARYNMTLNVPWLIVSNGIRHFCCRIDRENGTCIFEKEIPEYRRLHNSFDT
jgi:predicted type IV restriction endonuclease